MNFSSTKILILYKVTTNGEDDEDNSNDKKNFTTLCFQNEVDAAKKICFKHIEGEKEIRVSNDGDSDQKVEGLVVYNIADSKSETSKSEFDTLDKVAAAWKSHKCHTGAGVCKLQFWATAQGDKQVGYCTPGKYFYRGYLAKEPFDDKQDLPTAENMCYLGGGFGHGETLSFPVSEDEEKWDDAFSLFGPTRCYGPNNCYSKSTKFGILGVLIGMGVIVFASHWLMNRKHPRVRRYFERL